MRDDIAQAVWNFLEGMGVPTVAEDGSPSIDQVPGISFVVVARFAAFLLGYWRHTSELNGSDADKLTLMVNEQFQAGWDAAKAEQAVFLANKRQVN